MECNAKIICNVYCYGFTSTWRGVIINEFDWKNVLYLSSVTNVLNQWTWTRKTVIIPKLNLVHIFLQMFPPYEFQSCQYCLPKYIQLRWTIKARNNYNNVYQSPISWYTIIHHMLYMTKKYKSANVLFVKLTARGIHIQSKPYLKKKTWHGTS